MFLLALSYVYIWRDNKHRGVREEDMCVGAQQFCHTFQLFTAAATSLMTFCWLVSLRARPPESDGLVIIFILITISSY